MTSESRMERRLPGLLEELYLGRTPDYRDEVLATAVRSRQRPWWTFPGRWLPMADIASRPAFAPRLPVRALGMALLLIALLLAALALVVGSRQTRVPPPFGLASNGLIVYAVDGDIHTIDPLTGRTTAIVTGPENTIDPVFSPDGSRVAFRRDTTRDGSPAEEIVVVAADGSNPIVVTAMLGGVSPGYFEWGPDSRSMLVGAPDDSVLWLVDAVTPAAPRVIAANASIPLRPFRPPEGDAILIERTVDDVAQIVIVDMASGEETVLVAGNPGQEVAGARWSPTGGQVIYVAQPVDSPDSRRLYIANADGTGEPLQIPGGTRNEFDIDPAWSHDGSMIAFTRYEQIEADQWDVRPIQLYSVADHRVTEVGPRARDIRAMAPAEADRFASPGEGLWLEFSPDAKTVIAMPSEATGHPVLVDPIDGTWRVLDARVTPGVAVNIWQRTAP